MSVPASKPLTRLLPEHQEDLERSGLNERTISAWGAYTVEADQKWVMSQLALVRLAVRNLAHMEKGNKLFSVLSSIADAVRHRFRGNSLSGSRRNISYHYDLGNDFYRLFLGPTMAYSCAYYQTPDDSLE